MNIRTKLNARQREACGKRFGLHDEARLREMLHLSNKQIGKKLGFSRDAISAARKRLGLPAAPMGRPKPVNP